MLPNAIQLENAPICGICRIDFQQFDSNIKKYVELVPQALQLF